MRQPPSRALAKYTLAPSRLQVGWRSTLSCEAIRSTSPPSAGTTPMIATGTPLMYAFREREKILDLFESLVGANPDDPEILLLSARAALLDRQFDIVECVGVLHHMAEPTAGWRVLVNLLAPGGLMKIGLYSETARKDIVAAQSFAVERGYAPVPDDIVSPTPRS